MGYLRIHKNTSLLKYRHHIHAIELLNLILSLDTELEIAYLLKYEYEQINIKCTDKKIETSLEKYIEDLTIFNLHEFETVKKVLKNWKQEIINSFDAVDGRRISNGPVESVNSRIKLMKSSATGYGNFERFRKRVLYSLNKASTIKG